MLILYKLACYEGISDLMIGLYFLVNQSYEVAYLWKCNGCGLSVLAHGLRDSGELRLPPKGAVLSLALLLVRCLQ